MNAYGSLNLVMIVDVDSLLIDCRFRFLFIQLKEDA